MKLYSSSILLSILCILSIAKCNNSCNPRFYDADSFVCVCSPSFCDTIAPINLPTKGAYIRYTSDRDNHRFTFSEGLLQTIITNTELDTTIITINHTAMEQEMLGFGGAFTDATGINVKSLSEQLQRALLESYFGANGLEYNFGRVPIGGTDFSEYGYSYDDTTEADVNLEHFALQPPDYNYKLPLIRDAFALNPDLLLFASLWTAPKWMKTNGEYTGGAIKPEYYQVYADYFVKFFEAYAKEGVNFWGVTTGNEPSLALTASLINTVGWLPGKLRQWIAANLGPTIRNSTFHHLKIMALDDQRTFLPWYPLLVLRDGAEEYVDGIGVHWYADYIIPAFTLDMTHSLFPNLFILATEACVGDKEWEESVSLGAWERAAIYATRMIQDFNHQVGGFVDWNMALDTTGGPTYIDNNVDALILVNATAQEFYKQPMYYAMGHFSKFLPSGTRRVRHEARQSFGVEIVAFKRADSNTVVVVHNKNNVERRVIINDMIDITVTAKSINTIIY